MQKEIPKAVLDWIKAESDAYFIPNNKDGETAFYHNQYWIEEPIKQDSDMVICNCYTNSDMPITLVSELVQNKKQTLAFLRLSESTINCI